VDHCGRCCVFFYVYAFPAHLRHDHCRRFRCTHAEVQGRHQATGTLRVFETRFCVFATELWLSLCIIQLDQRKAHDRQASSDAGKARGTASTTQEFATSDTRRCSRLSCGFPPPSTVSFSRFYPRPRQENDQLLEIEMRSDIVLCQAVTTLVTCFVRKLRLVQRYMSPTAGRRLLSQYHQVGFYVSVFAQYCVVLRGLRFIPVLSVQVGFESLLSTAGSEYGMLGDHVMGVRWLSKFSFRLKPPPSRTSAVSPSSRPTGVLSRRSEGWFSLGREYGTSDWMEGGGVEIVQESENHYVIEVQLWQMEGSDTADRPGIGGFSSLFNRFVPKELLSGETIRVCPVLFSQGINERQTIANLIGRSSELQVRDLCGQLITTGWDAGTRVGSRRK
jgi:hypothetical protein